MKREKNCLETLMYASIGDTLLCVALLLKSQRANQDINGLSEYAKKLIQFKLCFNNS